MGFENLKQAIDEGRALSPLLAKDVVFSGEQAEDVTALALVIQNINVGERYLQSKTLPTEWNLIDDLYRAFVNAKTWPGTNQARSNLSMPLVLETIESLLPQTHMGFFSSPQPFELDPKGRTSPDAARAISKVVCWALEESGFEEEIRKMQKSTMLYGQCIGKWGWRKKKHKKKSYKQNASGDVEIHEKEFELSQPTFEQIDLRNLIVDPATRCHDIRTSRWRIHQKFPDAIELDEMREDDTYSNVPTREQLALIMAEQAANTKDSMQGTKQTTWRENQAELQDRDASANPLHKPLEILEYEDDDRIITVLNRCIVIRNEMNDEGCHYLSCSFIDVMNAFYGFGVAKLLEGEQRLQAGVANNMIDGMSLSINPPFRRKGGVGAKSQTVLISPGKVVNDNGELEQLEIKTNTEQALEAIAASEARAARRVGSNSGENMPNQAMRTAEGVQAFTSGVQVRLQYFIEIFAAQVFIPAIEHFIELCKDNLTPVEINAILDDADGKAFQGEILDVYNGNYEVDVLSSTKLAGRRAMQALIPTMMQLLGQPALSQLLNVQGKKFDFNEFFNEIFDISGWPATGLILDMTDEDKQRMAQSNPAVVNAQAKQGQMQQQHQNDLELEKAKGDNRAGSQLIQHALSESAQMRKENAETAAMAKPLATQGA